MVWLVQAFLLDGFIIQAPPGKVNLVGPCFTVYLHPVQISLFPFINRSNSLHFWPIDQECFPC